MYMRLWRGIDKDGKTFVSTESQNTGIRTIGLSESPTFSKFPKAQEILAPDADDPPDMEMYSSACTKLRDNLYVMFISCFY